jgi:hypothetical protein
MGIDWKGFWGGLFGAAAEQPLTGEIIDAPATAATSGESLGGVVAALGGALLVQQSDITYHHTGGQWYASRDGGKTLTPTTLEQMAQPIQRPAAAAPAPDEAAQLRAKVAEMQQQQVTRDATAFADQAVRDKHALPAERDAIVAMYERAAQADAHLGTTAQVEAVKTLITSRPAHTLTQELLPTGTGGALPNNASSSGPLTAERRQTLLAMSDLGQKVLAKK